MRPPALAEAPLLRETGLSLYNHRYSNGRGSTIERHPTRRPYAPCCLGCISKCSERHTDPAIANSPVELFASATECVYWAAVLDEQLRGTYLYNAFKNEHAAGALIPGIRYVRNLKTHSLAMTLDRIAGRVYPVTYPVAGSEVVWLPFDRLPPPQVTNKYTPTQEAAYKELMAGKPTRHTFASLDEGYSYLEGLKESPLNGHFPQFEPQQIDANQ